MARKWIIWWIASGFWFVLFLLGSMVVWMREVDGAGVSQTTELKFISFLVLVLAFIILALIQMVWFFVLKKSQK
ncbi:MAG TPA: DUF3923 family protein [Pseudogracilibacillus sp.]|nr:DUF3923 family protein [Pseudogracilibacillus sp.]